MDGRETKPASITSKKSKGSEIAVGEGSIRRGL